MKIRSHAFLCKYKRNCDIYTELFFCLKSIASARFWPCSCTDFGKSWTKMFKSNFLRIMYFCVRYSTQKWEELLDEFRISKNVDEKRFNSKKFVKKNCSLALQTFWSEIFQNSCRVKVNIFQIRFELEKISFTSSINRLPLGSR